MILYKYYPPNENTFKSLAVKGLWCHSPHRMNDPFESLWVSDRRFEQNDIVKFRQEIAKSKDSEILKFNLFDDEMLSVLFNTFRKTQIQRFAFCALSETPDNILMWSHYASSHTGIVIGFDFPNIDYHFQKVRYLSNLPKLSLKHYAKVLMNKDYNPEFFIKDISIKSKEWNYEKEWRVWGDRSGYYKYHAEQIKEIYFGINCEIETKAIVWRLLSEMKEDGIFSFNDIEFGDNPIKLRHY